jgi:hypothetical protein
VELHGILLGGGLDHPDQGLTRGRGQLVVEDLQLRRLTLRAESGRRVRLATLNSDIGGQDRPTRRGRPGGPHLNAVVSGANGVIRRYRSIGNIGDNELGTGIAGRIYVDVHGGRGRR